MYRQGKAIRNRDGKIIGGTFMSRTQAGNQDLTAESGRVQPDRRWFGNTRVVGQGELDTFRDEMKKRLSDPYSMVLRTKTLPMGLLTDSEKAAKLNLLSAETFQATFGKNKRRKRPKLSEHVTDLASLAASATDVRTQYIKKRMPAVFAGAGSAVQVGAASNPESGTAGDAAAAAESKASGGETLDAAALSADLEGAWDSLGVTDRSTELTAVRHWAFDAGQSRRIWAELYKVLDSSDVVLQVLDARDPVGTRSYRVEHHLKTHARHKQLIFVLNKCDLVPNWAVKKWVAVLSREYPTLAFHASMTNPFGKGNLIALLRQFSSLHEEKKQISVGLIGYPNVGKSSVINAVKGKKVCKVAPVPGETKVWQYITLMRRVFLIDCPGVVIPSGDSEADIVLKGVIRSERLDAPEDHIPELMRRVRPEFLSRTYGVNAAKYFTFAPEDGEDSAEDGEGSGSDDSAAGPGDKAASGAPSGPTASQRALAALLADHPEAASAYEGAELPSGTPSAGTDATAPVLPSGPEGVPVAASMTQPKGAGRALQHSQGPESAGGYTGRWQLRLEPGETFDGSHYLPVGGRITHVDHMGFLEAVGKRLGKLRKGGDPDTTITARNLINDFQRGKLPFYVRPPEKPEAPSAAGEELKSMVVTMGEDAADGEAQEAQEEEEEEASAAAAVGGSKRSREGEEQAPPKAKAQRPGMFVIAPGADLSDDEEDDFDDLDM